MNTQYNELFGERLVIGEDEKRLQWGHSGEGGEEKS